MPAIADAARLVTGGVDTHAVVHVAGMVDQAGRVLGTGELPAAAAGCRAALAWMRGRPARRQVRWPLTSQLFQASS